jgi:hypothetical protein
MPLLGRPTARTGSRLNSRTTSDQLIFKVENSNSVEPRQNISPNNMASCDNYLDKHRHPDGRKTTIPDHGHTDVPKGLFNKIIRHDLEISVDQFWNYNL